MGASSSTLDPATLEAYKAHPRLSIVITGGTNGIGEGIALTLGKLVAEPYIIIIGRSQVPPLAPRSPQRFSSPPAAAFYATLS